MLEKLSKVLFVIFIFYVVWFRDVFFPIANLPLVLGVSMLGLLLFSKFIHREKVSLALPFAVQWWLAFAVYTFAVGYYISVDTGLFLDSLMAYVQTLIMMIYIIDVSIREKSTNFFLKVYAVLGLVVSINLVFFGYDKYGQIMISAVSNPNKDGLIVLIGMFSVLLLTEVKTNVKTVLSILLILFFSYATILTSSRKSFAAIAVLIAMWYILVFREYMKQYSIQRRLILSFGFMAVLAYILIQFAPTFIESNLFYRLTEQYGYMGDELRVEMYKTAVENFKAHPLFGIGFNQFRVSYGTYSHSTYAESISNSGLIGTVLYFVPYFIIIYGLLKVNFRSDNIVVVNQARLYLIMMIIMIALGFGVIHFYGISFSSVFGLMIAYYTVELVGIRKAHEKEQISDSKILED